ncbi:unnamed protein product [Rotaria sp. Silwood1]|nr:unnamed protein product [Rotaria sp. Silwood1]CAF4834107.1 unnamed protein product [Rotaria sp. Silwood1]
MKINYSSIRFWSTLITDFFDIKINVINQDFGGSTLKQCMQRFKRIILPLEPRLLLLYAGENDITNNQTPTNIQFILTIRRFVSLLPIVYISIKPNPRRYDKIIQMNITNNLIREDIQNMNNVDYIDIFNQMLTSDGILRSELFISNNLHMNEQVYAIWTKAVKNYL